MLSKTHLSVYNVYMHECKFDIWEKVELTDVDALQCWGLDFYTNPASTIPQPVVGEAGCFVIISVHMCLLMSTSNAELY